MDVAPESAGDVRRGRWRAFQRLFRVCDQSHESDDDVVRVLHGWHIGVFLCGHRERTEGPYPDIMGMLNNPAFNRRDVTEGKPGTPLTLALTIVNANTGCGALGAAAVEIWQCDAAGNYSEYSQPGFNGSGQTFLRGVQTTDAAGQVTFNTIYPGWYGGRATHIHVDVYVNGRSVKVTQVAFPESTSAVVYASGVYASKGQNTTSNTRDNVFSDGTDTEMATVSGGAGGYTATLRIVI